MQLANFRTTLHSGWRGEYATLATFWVWIWRLRSNLSLLKNAFTRYSSASRSRSSGCVDYAYYVSLGLSQGLSLMCLSFLISLCVLGSLGECLMNYEGIMYIKYIPNINKMHDLKYRPWHHNVPNMLWIHNTHKHDNIHNQHKSNIINIIYIRYFCYAKNST